MIRVQLSPFAPHNLDVHIHCSIQNFEEGLVLQFQIDGDWETLKKSPPQTQTLRKDDLWKTTCFECFLAPVGGQNYLEYNISPSGHWNVYAFDAYRTGMRPAEDWLAPRIYQSFSSSQSTRTDVLIPKPDLSELMISPTMVVESKAGELSYWAPLHPAQKPDFHRREFFSIRI